jgi:ribosomal protein S18 acetylase RimI-like enzyme
VPALELRAAAAEDVDALARLERDCFDDAWSRESLAVWLEPGRGRAWLATLAGRPVGYALFLLAPGECELLRIGVAPPARRRSVARRLLAAALDRLADGGRATCHLEVRADNAAAIALYRSLGFAPGPLRARYYADGGDALRFARAAPARD